MDEGRIGLCRRVMDQHRKSVCILNDIAKAKQNVYTSFLSRERHVTSHRYFKSSRDVRRTVVRQKVLLKCMDMRRRSVQARMTREGVGPPSLLYGRYDGAPLHCLARDVELYIAARHPRLRRVQRVQRLLEEGVQTGELLDGQAYRRRRSSLFRLVQRPLGQPAGVTTGVTTGGSRGSSRAVSWDSSVPQLLEEGEGGQAGEGGSRRQQGGRLPHQPRPPRRQPSRLESRGSNSSQPSKEQPRGLGLLRVEGGEVGGEAQLSTSRARGGRAGGEGRRGGETERGDRPRREADRAEGRETEKKAEKKVPERRKSKPETGLTFDPTAAASLRRPTLVLPPIASTRELLRPIRRE